MHPEFVDHDPRDPELPVGSESVERTVCSLHGAFGELRFEVEDEIAEGDRVVERSRDDLGLLRQLGLLSIEG